MSFSPSAARTGHAALVSVDPTFPLPQLVVFQYNPDQLTRSLRPLVASADTERGDVLRLRGPAQETIQMDGELDATDQLEKAEGLAPSVGILPQLASLELMVSPKAAIAILNEVLALVGGIELIPTPMPLTILVWNQYRVVPVMLNDFTITEEAFDTHLNPIRAKVSLSLRVLTYTDLGLLSPGGALFLAHQIAKERLAALNLAATTAAGVPLPKGL
jgi:hypothetical protein